MTDSSKIRNFAIIAHIDHGKSTLADRLLEITHTIRKEDLGEQFLDRSEISRERGITIKLAPVRMNYAYDGENYVLDLIDTPGHVDFSYEVVRTLYACEGAVLLVDATKGIQAQTVAHYNFAKKLDLKIIPVINKIDLGSANIEKVEQEVVEAFGFEKEEILKISAKTGEGIDNLLAAIIEKIPAPTGNVINPSQALIFDSIYDEHRGIVIFVRLRNGKIKKGDEIIFLSDNTPAIVLDTGYMSPTYSFQNELVNGEVGFIITNIKDITQAKVGDTITTEKTADALPGYIPVKPFVFLSIFPASGADVNNLRTALLKLKLNDASLSFTPEHSSLFGPGFRCGFLGFLHSQILIERIEKEFGVEIFAAPPSIEYLVDGKSVTSPKDFDPLKKEILEPYVIGEIFTPQEYMGAVMDLIYSRRGEQRDITYFGNQIEIKFSMPLSSAIFDFYDKIKSVSSGFASFDYEIDGFRKSELVRVEVSLNETVIPELSFILHKDETYSYSRKIVDALSESIPKHQFVINVRASIGSSVIASAKISALSKNVLAKMSGGDYSRKSKLLDKQKEGKKKLKSIGNLSIPKEAFLSVLKV